MTLESVFRCLDDQGDTSVAAMQIVEQGKLSSRSRAQHRPGTRLAGGQVLEDRCARSRKAPSRKRPLKLRHC